MDKYNRLLTVISQKYNIPKGRTEFENDWKIRIIYSICGMMAYTSLWDNGEEKQPDNTREEQISIVHLKKRVRDILLAYGEMYPEVSERLPTPEALGEELLKIFSKAGIVYHCSNRVVPSVRREEFVGGICFQRGILPDDIECVSGVGFYSIQNGSHHVGGDGRWMFRLEEPDLLSLWKATQSDASWESGSAFDSTTEYLRMWPPFSHKYWINKPDITGHVSILRTGMKGSQLYYLYKYIEGHMEVSQLPQWQVKKSNYLTLANACLSTYEALPPIEYIDDGDLVYVYLNYLLPPRELDFLILYSWPTKYTDSPSWNFKRQCSSMVFNVIRNILTEKGYSFKERK